MNQFLHASGGVDGDTLTPWKDKPEAMVGLDGSAAGDALPQSNNQARRPMRKESGSEVSPRQTSRFDSDPLALVITESARNQITRVAGRKA